MLDIKGREISTGLFNFSKNKEIAVSNSTIKAYMKK